MPHAYLFTGPDGVGREMMAVGLAQVLLCTSQVQTQATTGVSESGHIDACGECEDCRLVRAGTHPDLFVIYRQLNREHPDSQVRKQKALNLGVDVIRHFVIDRVNRRPMRGRAKVFVIREAERLSDTAQNSLLKTLEEPPTDTFIVMITSALDRMLPTTKSRCQPVVFQPLPASFVSDQLRLMRTDVAKEELNFAARHSAGSLGMALRLIDDGLFAMKKTWGDHLMTLARPPRGFAPHLLAQPFIADAKAIGKLAAERDSDMSDTDATRVGIQALLGTLAGFYQDAQRRAVGAAVEAANDDQPQVIDAIASAHSPRQIVTALKQIAQADAAINRNAAPELTAEAMFIGLGAIAQGKGARIIYLTA
jgi:DNA polymerase III delta' subunit